MVRSPPSFSRIRTNAQFRATKCPKAATRTQSPSVTEAVQASHLRNRTGNAYLSLGFRKVNEDILRLTVAYVVANAIASSAPIEIPTCTPTGHLVPSDVDSRASKRPRAESPHSIYKSIWAP